MENPIQITNITEELTKLWNAEQGQKKFRASLFTLIIYLQKEQRTGYYQNIVKSVVSKFPCRVIMIINEENPASEYLRASVSAETIGDGFFCEIIQIEAAGSLIERARYLLLPHILPDLPVYLLWTQDPTKENAVLPHLEPLANRIIFDSESTTDLQNYSCAVMSLTKRFHCNIGDLNWSAISGWRAFLARVFNDPESFSALVESTRIEIVYNTSQTKYQTHTEIESAYLQAWIASRLHWKFHAIKKVNDTIELSYLRANQEVVFALMPQVADGQQPGAILGLDLISEKDERHYTCKKHPKTRQVTVQYSSKEYCQLPVGSYLGGTKEGQEIIEEIFYPTGGKHYYNMLEVLSLIPWRSI